MVCEGYNSQSQIQSQSYLLMYHAFSAAKERHRTKLRPPHRLERGKVRGAPPAIYHTTPNCLKISNINMYYRPAR